MTFNNRRSVRLTGIVCFHYATAEFLWPTLDKLSGILTSLEDEPFSVCGMFNVMNKPRNGQMVLGVVGHLLFTVDKELCFSWSNNGCELGKRSHGTRYIDQIP